MFTVGLALRSAAPLRSRIAALAMENVKDELVEQAFGIVRDEYIRLGGDDRTAKGGA